MKHSGDITKLVDAEKEYEQISMFDFGNTGYTRVLQSFYSSVPESGLLISEAFGVGDGRENVIADILIPNKFDVLYITGESGSGKTTILKQYAEKNGYSEYCMSESEKNTPLFLLGGNTEKDIERTLQLLTSVGLSDAVLWLNNYNELSDSQQARCEIAASIMHRDVIVVDEFLSTLDRETAYPVAYSIQKAIRKNKKRLIIATAHTDLSEYLRPDITIVGKAFPSRWNILESNVEIWANPIVEGITFTYGTKEDYRREGLGNLHYKGKYVGGQRNTFLHIEGTG